MTRLIRRDETANNQPAFDVTQNDANATVLKLRQEGIGNLIEGYGQNGALVWSLDRAGTVNPPGGITPTGPASGVLSGTYPAPGFAVDMATQAELDAHAAASDPHTVYQLRSEKAIANGYAGLGAGALVPMAQLASGSPTGSKFIRDDGALAVPPGTGGLGNINGVKNVLDSTYNADNTGASNATTVINTAITDAAAQPGGGIVYCPGGTYRIDTSVLMKSNVRLIGEGKKRTIFKAGNTSLAMVAQFAAATVNWSVEQIGFDFNAPATGNLYGVNVGAANCDGVTVTDCEFKNMGISTGDRIGILFNAAVSKNFDITNNTFTGTGTTAEDKTKGIWVLYGKNFTITGNTFDGCYRSCNLDNSASYNVSNFTISHNIVKSFGKYAILMSGVEWGTVVGNNIGGSVYPGGAGDSSVGVSTGQSGSQNSRYMAVTGNICNTCEVSAYDTEFVTIGGNNVSLAQAACIEVGKASMATAPRNITIIGNICDGSVNGSNITAGNVDGLEIIGNVSSGCSGVAIRVITSDPALVMKNVTIIGNTARTSQYGIGIVTAAGRAMQDITVAHNICTGNSIDGIVLSDLVDITNVRIEFNYCMGNSGVPINVGTNPTHVRRFGNITTTADYDTMYGPGSQRTTLTALTYSATIATDVTKGNLFSIIATNGTAFTISNPTGQQAGMVVTYDIKNSSGGAMGAITWGANFLLAGAFINPLNTKRRTISFYYDGTNWVETNRAAADI